ncbi:uncharacterized protein LOC135935839 [Cloeon dipterum]|uniref:uncharacterized protein LOC135935839 n=1 Tax=Cloeon dipterum TaxID=197152 RepID=UPI00321FEC7F
MPKGPAKLGYFVSKDQTIQNADNVCVLVVHYNFEKTKNETWIRIGDDQDVNNLKRTFGENRNCNFHDVLSPEKEELLELLSDQEKLLQLFGSSATRAKRNQSGSTFASLTCQVFNFLEKDESFINVLTTIQNESHKNVDFKNSVGQTPEVKMFSQDRSFVISKSPSNCSAFSTSDGIGIRKKKELEFYSWKSNKKENLRRRVAILFSKEQNDQLKEIKKVLSLNLDFETSERLLRGKPWMSINEASWSDSNIGCIFLLFFGILSEDKNTNEVCVQVDGQETAVSEILREFIGPKNEQWIGKPKILFLVNQETSSSDYLGSTQPKMKISATNHSGWLVLVLHSKDKIKKLIEIFKGQELKKEKSLQELLATLLISESKENKDLLNSTLQYPLNFPEWPKSFVKLNFSVTKLKTLEKRISFDSLLETGKSREECKSFIENFASKDILENPLHLSLVAKYGAKGNLYQIYDQVVRHKVEIHLQDREGYDKNNFSKFQEQLDYALESLQQLASCHIRGVALPDYTKDDLEKNNYYGIASFQDNKVIFIHQTFAEFLAAQYFLCKIDDFLIDTAKLFFGPSFSWCRKNDEGTSDGSSDDEDDKVCMDYFLMLQKIDINMTDKRGKTALHCAAEHAYLERVKELIHSGANVRAVDENGWNAFHFACSSRRYLKEGVIRLWHSTDSQLAKEKSNSGQTGLHILMESSKYCSDNEARFLVEEIGVDARAKDNNGCTALRIAVNKGVEKCVDYLMTKDIDLEVKNKRGRTCLHFAAGRGDLEDLQTWIELGGDLNVVDEKGMTALHLASEKGHLQFVEKLLACAAEEAYNPDIGEGCVGSKLKKNEILNRCDNGGRTALHFAAKSGNVDLVKWLIENNADLTQTDPEGKNAIHFAIRNERMLRFLNEKNRDLVKQRTKYGDTTLHLAIKRKSKVTEEDEQISVWIIGQVDDTVLNAKNYYRQTPLLLACEEEWWKVAELLLTRNVEVNVSDRSGKTVIHYAAEKGNLSLVKLLLEKGADLTLRDNKGKNALHHAIDHLEVISFLHEKNNELLGQRLKDGDTTLHLALKTWDIDTDTIRWLVEHCENDLNVTNSEGDTPLMLACKRREWIIAKILLAKTIDIDTKDENGRTAFHYAVNWWSNSDIKELHAFYLVQELCKRGADLALTDNDGMNAFHHAIPNFHMALFIHNLNGDLVKQRLNNGDTSLHLAIKLEQDIRDIIFPWLVEQCENDLNVTNSEGDTPLLLAFKKRKLIIAKFLLAKTVDIDTKDKNGRTALHYAIATHCWSGNSDALDLVQELCKRGADLASTDNDGMNAFHHAMENFNMAIFIHEMNGDLVKQRLNNGDTSLHLAIKLCSPNNILIWLVEQGDIDLNATNALNETPLILACKYWNENRNFVDLLMSKNVDVLVKDNQGKCALHYFNKFCPTHLRGSYVDIEEASPSKKMRMS